MKIKEISFKNFNSYGNIKQTIKLDGESKLILIEGDNGTGKTTIADVISYSCYNSVPGRKLSRIPNRYNKALETNIHFTNIKGNKVKIDRGLSPRFFNLEVDGKPKNTSIKDINEYVENELIGIPYEVFSNSILLSLGDFESFVKMKIDKKRKIIDKIFDSNIINLMYSHLKDERREKEKELQLVIENRDSVNDAIDVLVTINNGLNLDEDEYNENVKVLNELEKAHNKLISSIGEKIAIANKTEETVNADIENKTKEADVLNGQINNKHNEINNKYKSIIVDKKNEVEKEIKLNYNVILNRLNDDINLNRKKINYLYSEIETKLNDELMGFKRIIDDLISKKYNESKEKLDNEINQLNVDINEINNLRNKLETEKAVLEKQLAELSDSIIQPLRIKSDAIEKEKVFATGICPTCGTDLKNNHTHKVDDFKNIIKVQDQIINDINVRKEKMKSDIGDIDAKIKQLDTDKQQLLFKVNEKISKLNSLERIIRDALSNHIKEKENKIRFGFEQIKKENEASLVEEYNNLLLKYNEINSEMSVKIDEAKSKIDKEYQKIINDEITKTLNDDNQKYQKLRDGIVSLNLKLKELSAEKDELNDKKMQTVLTFNTKSEPHRSYVNNYNKNKKTKDDNDKKINLLNKQIDELEKTIEEYEYELSVYNKTYELLDENGIKRTIIDSNLPTFNDSIAKYVSYLDYPYDFSFDNKFDASIYKYNYDVDPSELSKGETRLMDLIIILSVFDLIIKKIPDLNVIFLDEIFTNLSVVNTEKVVKLLSKYSKTYDINIFVVSHTPVPVEYFDVIYQTRKEDDYSYISEVKK